MFLEQHIIVYLVFAVVECNFLSSFIPYDAMMDCKEDGQVTFLKADILDRSLRTVYSSCTSVYILYLG